MTVMVPAPVVPKTALLSATPVTPIPIPASAEVPKRSLPPTAVEGPPDSQRL